MRGRRLQLACAGLALVVSLARSARAGEDDLPPPPPPDLGFFVERIAPWLERACATCHRRGGGDLRLADPAVVPDERARHRADFESVRAFVREERPEESPLYLKALAPADGGDVHAGGAHLTPDEETHDALLDFLFGATLDNLAPDAWLEEKVLRARPGDVVVLDASDSYDRDQGDELVFRWRLLAVPPGAAPALSDARRARLRFTPSEPGTYVLRLRVGDGKVWSVPRDVTVEVYAGRTTRDVNPAAISGLDAEDPRHVRRMRRLVVDVLGRSPRPAEIVDAADRDLEPTVRRLLASPDAARALYDEAVVRMGLVDDVRPVGEEAAALPLRLAAEGLPPHVVEGVLARDPAFLAAHPPGLTLADAIARRLLGRAPTPEEREAGVRLARGKRPRLEPYGEIASARAWIDAVLASDAFVEAAVVRRMARFLSSGDRARRLPGALTAARGEAGAWRTFLAEVLADPGTLDRPVLRSKDDLTFVRGLFVDLLGRLPTERERSALLHALEALPGRTAPRAALVKVLLDSGEVPLPLLVDIRDGPRWLNDRFLRYLGRGATDAEMEAYARALLDPAGGPELVVRALLTGPEYHCR